MMATLRLEDLPAWMRPRSRVVDRGWLVVLGFSLLLVLPLLTRRGLPATSDADLYAYRSLEIKRLLQSGTVYSRWSPDFNYTFGSPLFNYLAPLPHYLTGLHQDVTESDPITSIRLLIGLSILAAGSGMYFFIHGRWGSYAALIAALVYIYSPPLALTLPYQSSDLGPLLALAILPWSLWALDRLWQELNRTNLWIATLALSAFVLSDNRIALLGLPIIIVAMIALKRRTWPQRRAYRYILVAMLSAVLLCAFFWLPALAERDAVHWLPLTPDMRSGPVPLTEILSATPHYGSLPVNLPIQRNIGPGTWLLALAGVVGITVQIWRRNRSDGVLSFLVLGTVLLIAATPAFGSLWTPGFQSPWAYHALMLSIFCLAIVAGQSAYLLQWLPSRLRIIGLIIAVLIAPLTVLPTIYPPQWQPDMPGYSDITQSEIQKQQIGTFRDGILLPADASHLFDPPPDLLDQLRFSSYQRVKPVQYASETHISSLEQGLLRNHYIIDTSQPVVIQFNTLYYPGWTVSLNGQIQAIQPSSDGLITVTLPRASNDVVFSFEGTPFRKIAWTITLSGTILILLASRRLRRIAAYNTLNSESNTRLSRRELITLGITLLFYAALVLMTYARQS
jgi:hypothetical protein